MRNLNYHGAIKQSVLATLIKQSDMCYSNRAVKYWSNYINMCAGQRNTTCTMHMVVPKLLDYKLTINNILPDDHKPFALLSYLCYV